MTKPTKVTYPTACVHLSEGIYTREDIQTILDHFKRQDAMLAASCELVLNMSTKEGNGDD